MSRIEMLDFLFGNYWLGIHPTEGEAPTQCPGQLQLQLDIDAEMSHMGWVRGRDLKWYKIHSNQTGSWLQIEGDPDGE